MSIAEKSFKLQVDRRILEPYLNDDDAIYWAQRTLQILPKAEVVVLNPEINREWKMELAK